ncbi:MAG: kinase/pyrophosphorylase [Coriobacteriia bacterium]|nr:kinase/pyrophosphorylase [Coriobacteriia bacterium]
MGNEKLTIHVLSDSLGETADMVARAAASQFPADVFELERLPRISTRRQLRDLVMAHCKASCIFFYTFAKEELRSEMRLVAEDFDACAVDVLGPAVAALAGASDTSPSQEAGVVRRTDQGYFHWLEAVEYAVKHDDGRNPEGLAGADVVLIGVSRTSKTPLSMYLGFKGFRTANVPLAKGSAPPHELFDVDPKRVFGLTCDADLLARIRTQRMSELGAYARGYADREAVERELEEARRVMRTIGCLVVRTNDRAIEETAHEIIRYLGR